VLIVDDDVRNIFALTAALEGYGMIVKFAESGKTAIEMLEADADCDVVLMDVMMPEMDGNEATRRLRRDSRFAKLPIIAVTAKAMKGDRERSIESGASDYITKPVDTEKLISLLRVWLYR
jgi:CheY-like chemotaxis protein